jgi:phosphoribosylformimino-5-aminoimidazole carboxamide ribonucleotide (ProFAR) isomerase
MPIASGWRLVSGSAPGRIVVGIDARDGKVAVEGWTEGSEISAVDLGRRFEDAGVSAIVYTDIARDGMMQGSTSKPPPPSPAPAACR